ATNSPVLTSRLTSSTARTTPHGAGYTLLRFSNRITTRLVAWHALIGDTDLDCSRPMLGRRSRRSRSARSPTGATKCGLAQEVLGLGQRFRSADIEKSAATWPAAEAG